LALDHQGRALAGQAFLHRLGHVRSQSAGGQYVANALDDEVLDGLRGQRACRACLRPFEQR
jgi:hypothetical protein